MVIAFFQTMAVDFREKAFILTIGIFMEHQPVLPAVRSSTH